MANGFFGSSISIFRGIPKAMLRSARCCKITMAIYGLDRGAVCIVSGRMVPLIDSQLRKACRIILCRRCCKIAKAAYGLGRERAAFVRSIFMLIRNRLLLLMRTQQLRDCPATGSVPCFNLPMERCGLGPVTSYVN